MVLLSYTSMAGVPPSISQGELPFQAVSCFGKTRVFGLYKTAERGQTLNSLSTTRDNACIADTTKAKHSIKP